MQFKKVRKVLIIVNGLLIFLLGSCQKKTPAPTNEEVPATTLPAGTITSYDALFACYKVRSRNGGAYGPSSNNSYGYYSSETIQNEAYSSSKLLNVGQVSLNGIGFKNGNAFVKNYYNDSTAGGFVLPHNWRIGGGSGLDSFYFSVTTTAPEFEGQFALPDSMSISQGLNFTVKKLSKADFTYVFINGGSGSTTFPSRLVASNDSIIYFSPEQLNGLTISNNAYFNIQFYKDTYRQINGKKVNFREGLSFVNYSFKIKK